MSRTFQIEIIETLSKTITIIDKDDLSALQKVKEGYKNEVIVLDNNDYVTTDFVVRNVDDGKNVR